MAGGQATAAEEPTMAVALAVDPSSSIIAATKEQSYYDDLITLADVELPNFPFDLQDNDLTAMLPAAERGNHPVLEGAELHPVTQNPGFPTDAQFQMGMPLPVQLAQPGSHGGGMRMAAPMEPVRPAEVPKPKKRGQKRETSSTQAGANCGATASARLSCADAVPLSHASTQRLILFPMVLSTALAARSGWEEKACTCAEDDAY